MTDPDCCPVHDDPIGRYFVPFLCFLYRFANRGHAFEASIGIPSWMSWFSTPDLSLLQIFEAGLLLMILSLLSLVLLYDMLWSRSLRLRGWDWKIDVRAFGAAGLVGWLEMCLMRAVARSSERWGTTLGVIYTMFVFPTLFHQLDRALCWLTGKTMISDHPGLQRFALRVVLGIVYLLPTMMLITTLGRG